MEEKLEASPLISGTRYDYLLSPLILNTVLKLLAIVIEAKYKATNRRVSQIIYIYRCCGILKKSQKFNQKTTRND